jgi:hypothetical protein
MPRCCKAVPLARAFCAIDSPAALRALNVTADRSILDLRDDDLLEAVQHLLISRLTKQISGCLMALVLAATLVAGPSLSAENDTGGKAANPFDLPMYFAIVRSNAGYCEPNCPEWIYGEGQIDANTPSAFRKVLSQMGGRQLPLVLISPGGNVEAAVEMGRLIRKNKIAVQIGYTRFFNCSPRDASCIGDSPQKGEFRGMAMVDGAFCWSACPLVLAGGERRLSSEWSYTGVHQVTTVYQRQQVLYRERYRVVDGKKKVISRKVLSRKDAGTQSTTRLPKATRTLLTGYFREMGVEKTLLKAMLSTTPDKIRRLLPNEMLTMHLITELSNTDLLTDPTLCRGDAPAVNCVTRNPLPQTTVTPQSPPTKT